jgi:hypothetical protein
MKTTISTLGMLALMGAAAAGAGVASADAAQGRIKSMMKPLAGVSFDIGSSHAMAYFVPDQGKCNLTMVLAEIPTGDAMPASAGTRLNVGIEAGKRARIDTAAGKSVEFICAPGATMVSLRKLETVAHSAMRTVR